MKPNLLIVDDEKHTRDGLELALEDDFEIFVLVLLSKLSKPWIKKSFKLF